MMGFESLHWFWFALFVALALFLISAGRSIGSVRMAFCNAKIMPEEWKARIGAAIVRREGAEGRGAPLGQTLGAGALIVAVLVAVTPLQVGLLYALLCY